MSLLPIKFENWVGAIRRFLPVTILLLTARVACADFAGIPGQLAVGRDTDGRLHIFKVDKIGELRHRWQEDPRGDWTSWSNLGGSVLPGIAVTTNGEGLLDAFAVNESGGSLAWIHQKTPNGPWSKWHNLGGKIQAPVAVDHDAAGNIEIFAVNAAGNVLRLSQMKDGAWSSWTNLGGHVQPGIAVISILNGCLEVFGVDADCKTLMYCRETASNTNDSWAGWQNLGGTILPGIAVGENTNGTLEIFGVDSRTSTVDYLCQNVQEGAVQWSGWTNFGPIKVLDGLTIHQNQDGRLELFAVGRENQQVFHRWQVFHPFKRWFPVWDSLGGQAIPPIAAGLNQDGSQEIFAIDAGNGATLSHIRQIRANSDWLNWFSIEYRVSPYRAVCWQTDEGLPHNVVEAIAQTPDGHLWVGTQAGLARFDGVQFKVFDSKNTRELKDSHITALCVDLRGALWIGTSHGLVRLQDGIFTHYSGRTARKVINVIDQSRDGSLWVGTDTGLSRFQNGVFHNFGSRNGLSTNSVRAIYQDQTGILWVGSAGGLYQSTNAEMDKFAKIGGLQNNAIRGITQDKGGRMWIGSDDGMIWHHLGGEFYAYDRRYGLSDPFVNVVCEDNQGNLWVGTHNGLNRFSDGRFFNELDNDGDPYDEVNTIFEGRSGSLWIGSNEGLAQLTAESFFAYDMRQGLSHNDTVSVLQDHEGNIWIGTYGGGLNEIRDESVVLYCTTNGLLNDEVLALCESRDGSMWAGEANDGGLYEIKNGKIRRYTSKDGLIGGSIRVIHEDRLGNLWIGTSDGLSRLTDGAFHNYGRWDYHAGRIVRTVCEDREGRIWFGTNKGLCRLDGTGFVSLTKKQGLSDNSITALYDDANDNLWIGTENSGLDRLSDGRISVYTTQRGLFSDDINEIIEDDYGWLWMSCPKGIFRVRKSDLDALDRGRKTSISCISYGKSDGMETTLCNGLAKPSAWKSQNGQLWFVTTKGLVVVNPRLLKSDTTPLPVFIEEMLVDGKTAIDISPDSSAPSRLRRIPPGRGGVEFTFTMLDFKKPDADHFLCMLKGVDSDWVDVGSRRSANYNNLKPGRYTFLVKACDSDGIWNETGASLDFVLLPHYWQTWWFDTAAALMAVMAVSVTARYLTWKRMQRKMELLERQNAVERERSRIAKDIHDDLGSRLTRMMLLGQRVQEDTGHPEKLVAHAKKMVDSAVNAMQIMDEIVWAVDPQKDTLNGLIGYITQYANEFLEETHIRCRLEMPVNVPAVVIPAEARHELFLALKEALTNSVKHSHASEVRIVLRESGGVVTLIVEDNGCGIANGAVRGSGLENIVKRMEKLRGDCKVTTVPGSGTNVQMTFRLN